ncbi:hypothetical protein ACSX1A_05470 [Pontibacter sp. MBLB2868]|uniref:hypothetical protein n=1 Tax=Pontibacter sp. MBLB2868 TaxID=3451555 RepID=UPI003F74C0EC
MLIENQKCLYKANGDVFFEAGKDPGNNIIYVNWIGIQSLETAVMGGNYILSMLRDHPARGILNSNRELIGPWESAVNWLVNKWAPQAKMLGLKYYAHVLSPGIYGQRSFNLLRPHLEKQLEVSDHPDEDSATEWLENKLKVTGEV